MTADKMMQDPIWHDDVAASLLHIIPQGHHHGDCEIYGAPEALRRLGEALISAARTGENTTLSGVMPRDGEGYHVKIKSLDQWQMQHVPLPYAQLGHSWDFDPPPSMSKKSVSLEDIQRRLDRHILEMMEDGRDPTYGREGYGFPLKYFVVDPVVTKEMVRAACRSLTDRGFACYIRGLWSDDGMPCGAGYGITAQGFIYLQELMAADDSSPQEASS